MSTPPVSSSHMSAFEPYAAYEASPDRLLRNPNLFNADPSQFYAFLATVSSDDDEDFMVHEEPSQNNEDEVIVISKRELDALKSDTGNNPDSQGPVTIDQLETLRWQLSSHVQLLIQTIVYSACDESTCFAFNPCVAHLQHFFQLYTAATGFLSVAGLINPRESHFYTHHIKHFQMFFSVLSNTSLPLEEHHAARLLAVFEDSMDPLLYPSATYADHRSQSSGKVQDSLEFTSEEDSLLICGVRKFGKRYSKIHELFLPQRGESIIKSRIKSIKERDGNDELRQKLEQAFTEFQSSSVDPDWSEEDDIKLIKLVSTFGHDFSKIATHFPAKYTRSFLRNYWCRKLAGTSLAFKTLGVDEGSLPSIQRSDDRNVYNRWICGYANCNVGFGVKNEVYVHYFRDHLKLYGGSSKGSGGSNVRVSGSMSS
ncbi:hypothetical protein P9112_001940 [Eukaryota sp. TZLM1-RC]